jgi:hypothetical protein
MELQLSHLRAAHLPRPQPGQSGRFRLGRVELVLEPVRGGYSLLCLDGTQARTWSLGLARDGELWLACRVPRWPLRIALKDTLVLVPKSRVRGYVHVPLVPTLCWRTPDGAEATVAELLPPLLSAEWDELRGTCTQSWTSPLFQRLPPADGEPRAMLPLTIRNDGPRMQSPESLPVALADAELQACRGHLVAPPRRLHLGEREVTTSQRTRGAERRA